MNVRATHAHARARGDGARRKSVERPGARLERVRTSTPRRRSRVHAAANAVERSREDDWDEDTSTERSSEANVPETTEDGSVIDAPEETEEAEASVRDLARFTLPTMAIWLCDPLLSLVDTSVVGTFAGTLELAAIAPGSVYAGYPAYLLCTGFAVATTSMVGQDRLTEARLDREDEAERTVSAAVLSASVAAILGGALLVGVMKPALSAYVGATNVALMPYASAYAFIRILALPVGCVNAVVEAAFLAVRDPWTPLKAVTLTTVLNLVLDVSFVAGFGWGVAGAAAATSMSQVITMVLLLRALVRRGSQVDEMKKLLKSRQFRDPRTVKNTGAPALRLPFQKPRPGFYTRLRKMSVPVMVVALIKCIFVGWIVRSATAISPEASAANGVLLSVYFFFAVVGEGVSQAAQTFLPAQLGKFKKALQLSFRILIVSMAIGVFNAVLSGLLPTLLPQMFTKNAAVVELMLQAVPFMSLSLLAHTASMASEGCLLAARDGVFMSLSYIPNAALSCITLAVLQAADFGVRSSWIALFQFHCVRLVINAVRLRFGPSPLKRALVLPMRAIELGKSEEPLASIDGSTRTIPNAS